MSEKEHGQAGKVAATNLTGGCMEALKAKLIANGVKNLNAFGYQKCTSENILSDAVYKEFFASMLKENKGHGKDIDAAIDSLLAQIEG